jgi:hypothetical protein
MPLLRIKQNSGEIVDFPPRHLSVSGGGVHEGQIVPRKRKALGIIGQQHVGIEG